MSTPSLDQPSFEPVRLMTPTLPESSSKRTYEPTLPTISQIVETKLFSDIKSLVPVFENADIPWIEHDFKTTKNKRYREVTEKSRNFTRTRRASSVILKVSDLLKILHLTRTRKVAPIRTHLALREMWHRRRCAGRVGRFSMKEFRRFVGSTRITDAEVLEIVKSPKIELEFFYLRDMLVDVGRDSLDRPVWVPRRTLRYLAEKGTRLEIACMTVLLLRRMHGRLGRARCSAKLISRLTGAKEDHVRTALLSLQEKGLIMRNRQAERWSVNKFGSLWEFPTDLTINPKRKTTPLREAPKRKGKWHNLTLSEYLKITLETSSTQKGGDLINTDPTLQLEPQQLSREVGRSRALSTSEAAVERRKSAAAAAALKFNYGKQGFCYRHAWSNARDAAAAAEAYELFGYGQYAGLRAEYPPHEKGRRICNAGETEAERGDGCDGLTAVVRWSYDDRPLWEGEPDYPTGEAASLGHAEALGVGLYGALLEDERDRESYRSEIFGSGLGMGRGRGPFFV